MNVDEALQQPGQLVAAWDDAADDPAWLGIYAAGDGGVKLLAFERLDKAARDKRLADLATRPASLGTTSGGEFVWSVVGEQFMAWNLRKRLFVATRREVAVGVERVADVARVTSFVDANDLGHRGVRVERASGGQLVLADERDPTPEMDPTYDRSNVALDAAWASALGRALASWLGVPHIDQI